MPTSFPKIRLKQVDLEELNDFVNGKIYGKVDKETGKGLSTNDFTDEDKQKLDQLITGTSTVTSSTINGNIKVDGNEMTVYTHPGSGTNPHGTTATDIGLGNVENKSSATIRSELTLANIENAIGTSISSISDKNYVFTQSSPATQWVIQHNLNKYCMVKIFDDSNNEVFADINYVDGNNLIIVFTRPISGKAYLN